MNLLRLFSSTNPATHIEVESDIATELAHLETVLYKAPIGFGFVDKEFRYLRVNDMIAEAHGLSAAEHIGKKVSEVVGDWWPKVEVYYNRALAGESTINEFISSEKDGKKKNWIVSYYPVLKAGQTIGVGLLCTDLTDRKRAEESSAQAKSLSERLSAIVESSDDAIIGKDLNGIVTSWNRGAQKIFGFTASEMIGKSLKLVIPPERHGEEDQILARLRRGEHVSHFETIRRTKDGREIHVDVSASPIANENGVIVAASKIARDITPAKLRETEKAEALKRLAESQARYQCLFEYAPSGILILNEANEYIDANVKACRMFGYSREELLKLTPKDVVAPIDANGIDAGIAELDKNQNYLREWRLLRKNGEEFPAEVTATPMPDGTKLVMISDISERKHLESQFLHSQKMEAIGILAGGVAHDFNNILAIIGLQAELVQKRIPDDDQIKKGIESIMSAQTRGARLTRQLLDFSRKHNFVAEPVDIDNAVTELTNMLRQVVNENVQLEVSLSSQQKIVSANKGQVEQIVMNLVVNALDAVKNSGQITISTSVEELSTLQNFSANKSRATQFVRISVKDSGSGMDQATLNRIFEPFFTTKEIGKGTGLGLATVHGIVTQNQGFIDVQSRPKEGSCFNVFLPLSTECPEDKIQVCNLAPTDAKKLKILIAEDQEDLREIIREALVDEKFDVLTAQNGQEALDMFMSADGSIDLILTDVVMPVMGGRELIEKIAAQNHKPYILLMSGYTEDLNLRSDFKEKTGFIDKPFASKALIAKIKELLSDAQAV